MALLLLTGLVVVLGNAVFTVASKSSLPHMSLSFPYFVIFHVSVTFITTIIYVVTL